MTKTHHEATIQIRCIETGETVRHYDAYDFEQDERHTPPEAVVFYMWFEGNYSCDCNRYLFFQRASGFAEDDIDDHPCGEDKFTIDWIVFDGRCIYPNDGPRPE